MTRSGRTPWITLTVALLLLPGCGRSGQEVTPEAIARARQVWERAKLRDYDLEWKSSGQMNGRYRVAVRKGQVQRIDSVLDDGRTVEMHPARPSFYSVDGLFVVIEDELAQLKSPTPFGRPRGTKAILRFTPDPELGYPRSYRRDVVGTPQGVAIDVLKLDTRPALPSAPTPSA